jgi:hypothetical protein
MTIKLPPLPDPSFELVWLQDRGLYKVTKPNIGDTYVYTADQMQAYAIAAIEAYKQQQGEAVAWMLPSEEGCDSAFRDHATVQVCTGNKWEGWIPLYTHPASAQQANRDPLHDDIQSVLFEVEQAVENGCCPWQIEAAFEAYEAAQRLQQPAHGIGGEK